MPKFMEEEMREGGDQNLRKRLRIGPSALKEVNQFLLDPDNSVINGFLRVVEKYGTPGEINAKARRAQKLSNLIKRLQVMKSPYLKDLEWLMAERDKGSFISVSEFRRKVLGRRVDGMTFDEAHAVTLEISAFQYFPWLITEARQAIEKKEIMPSRYIRVRKMKEQESDQGDTLAVAAAMQIVGASYVETLDTKGTDGSNVHLGGPETITGYFGGIGQPNEHALQWIDEYLYYYTNYGIRQVLNINPGTVLLGYLLHKLGVDMEFKISVFMGNDNPYAVLWTLMAARLFSRKDGSTPLIGFNLSNSVDCQTLELSSEIRKKLGLEENVRIEHHITETWKSIVRQPYNRRCDLLEIAPKVPNISAKHEGGDPDIEQTREHASDILDYFRNKDEVLSCGDMPCLERNYLDKHEAVNRTAIALTEKGLAFVAAWNLHRR
jgi:bifunctional DNA-binding transcriptional regulator/antitoxin component of YhaV-PrlF toxin-antitoxin module